MPMLSHSPQSLDHRLLTFALLLGLAFTTAAAHGQPAPEPAEPSETEEDAGSTVALEVDIEALLRDGPTVDAVSGAVWVLKPATGRRLVRLPVRFEPPSEAVTVSRSALRVSGGRFVAWELPAELSTPPADAAIDSEAPPITVLRPRISRSLKLIPAATPVGQPRVAWSMERVIFGGELLKTDSLYPLKINSDWLKERDPGGMPSAERREGETSRDYSVRRRTELEAWREKAAAFRALRRAAIDAPSDFEAPLPPIVWGIFEVNDHVTSLGVTGSAAGPWDMPFKALTAIQQLAAGAPRGENGSLPSETTRQCALAQSLLAGTPHPYTQQLIALALSRSGLFAGMVAEDPTYNLAQRLLELKQPQARRVIFTALGASAANAASRKLLASITDDLTPELQLARLKAVLVGAGEDAAAVGEAGELAGRTLADPQGPSAAQVLQPLLDAQPAHGEANATLVSALDLKPVPADRLAAAATFIVQHAPSHPLARAWLETSLLAGNATTAHAALDAIAKRVAAPAEDSPVAPDGSPQVPTTNDDPSAQPHAVANPLPVRALTHPWLTLLASDDAKLRVRAWDALPYFHLATEPAPVENSDAPAAPSASALDEVVRLALRETPTPPTLLHYLENAPADQPTTVALLMLAAGGDAKSAATAMKLVQQPQRPVGEAMLALNDALMHRLVARFYEQHDTKPPAATGLLMLKDEGRRHAVRQWFGQRVQEGKLPVGDAWLTAIGGDTAALDILQSDDAASYQAALSALAHAFGGTDAVLPDLNRALVKGETQTDGEWSSEGAADPNATLASRWPAARKMLIARSFEGLGGPYRLMLRLPEKTVADADPEAPGEEPTAVTYKDVNIALLTLEVKADGVSIANESLKIEVPADQRVIRVLEPLQLQNFNVDALQSVTWPTAPAPVDLRPVSDTRWEGALSLPEAGEAIVVLERAKE